MVASETVPVGVMKAPGETSVTVTLQEAALPIVTDKVQLTLVVVARRPTAMVPDVPELPA